MKKHKIEIPSETIYQFAREYVANKQASSTELLDTLELLFAYGAGAKKAIIFLNEEIQKLEDQIEALQKEINRLRADANWNTPF